ncbi:hypothetical protein K457DRAFT_524274 [Linnemannia elongata AG-77]|uniref:Hydrophobin n=1 Tax=Linnemannia elongata AG-77 TaxID=1314771 RepID=A0A197JX99_9FUNG|nr:hypothetical protein K457DRAFT_524274 [Linnemannia elongata AG-77]
MRCYLPVLLAALALGLVSAQDSCSDTTIPICCSSFIPIDSPDAIKFLGEKTKGPKGDMGQVCTHAPEAGCPSPKTRKSCRYFMALLGLAAGCVDATEA